MNIFERAKNNEKLSKNRLCFFCEKEYIADKRNLKRGWGLFCSKSCSIRHLNHLRSLPLDKRKSIVRDKNLLKLGIL